MKPALAGHKDLDGVPLGGPGPELSWRIPQSDAGAEFYISGGGKIYQITDCQNEKEKCDEISWNPTLPVKTGPMNVDRTVTIVWEAPRTLIQINKGNLEHVRNADKNKKKDVITADLGNLKGVIKCGDHCQYSRASDEEETLSITAPGEVGFYEFDQWAVTGEWKEGGLTKTKSSKNIPLNLNNIFWSESDWNRLHDVWVIPMYKCKPGHDRGPKIGCTDCKAICNLDKKSNACQRCENAKVRN